MSSIYPKVDEQGFHLYLKIQTQPGSLENKGYLHNDIKYVLNDYFNIRLDHYYEFFPQGSSGSFILAESHANYHTFPEKDIIVIDIYSCVCKINVEELKLDIFKLFGNCVVLSEVLQYRT